MSYILEDDIPEDERVPFIEWMRGRQVPIIADKRAYYRADYEWWVKHEKSVVADEGKS